MVLSHDTMSRKMVPRRVDAVSEHTLIPLQVRAPLMIEIRRKKLQYLPFSMQLDCWTDLTFLLVLIWTASENAEILHFIAGREVAKVSGQYD